MCGKFCCPSSTIILAFVMQKLKTYLKNFFAMINKDWGDTAVMREAYSTWEIPHNIGLCHAKIENIPKIFFAMINKDWGDTAVMREAYSTWEIPQSPPSPVIEKPKRTAEIGLVHG